MNVTAWTNMSGAQDLFVRPNLVTSGLWGYTIFGILYLIFIVVFAKGMEGDSNAETKAFTSASVIMIPVSALMSILADSNGVTMVPVYLTIFPIICSVIGVIYLSVNNR